MHTLGASDYDDEFYVSQNENEFGQEKNGFVSYCTVLYVTELLPDLENNIVI